jgi:hypothetical protein
MSRQAGLKLEGASLKRQYGGLLPRLHAEHGLAQSPQLVGEMLLLLECLLEPTRRSRDVLLGAQLDVARAPRQFFEAP